MLLYAISTNVDANAQTIDVNRKVIDVWGNALPETTVITEGISDVSATDDGDYVPNYVSTDSVCGDKTAICSAVDLMDMLINQYVLPNKTINYKLKMYEI
jgi:hypothetical protein